MRSAAVAFLVRFALVGALLLTWALGIGRYGGPDEPAHVLRSFAAAHGHLIGDPADPLPAGYRVVSVPASLASGDPSCYRHDARTTSACAAPDPAADRAGEVRAATSAGLTPPLYHLAVGTIVRLIGDPGDTAWYRAVAALLHAAVLALTLTRLRGRPRMLTLVIASITPAAWFLFGVVNPNSFEIALAVLAWVGVARFVETPTPTRADAWWIAAPMAIAVVVRPIAIVAALAMVLTLELRRGAGRHRRWTLTIPLAVAVAAAVGWNLFVDIQIDDPRTAVHRSVLASVGDSLGSLHITAREAVGSLGWNEFGAPHVAVLAWVIMWLALLLTTVVGARRAQSAGPIGWRAPVAWLAVLVATPVLFEVALAASVGPIWQGRYSLAVLLGLPLFVHLGRQRPRGGRVLVGLVVGSALIEVATYWATVHRYAVGSHGSWLLRGQFRSTALLQPSTWLVVHLLLVSVAVVLAGREVARDQTM